MHGSMHSDTAGNMDMQQPVGSRKRCTSQCYGIVFKPSSWTL